ncbi:MAG: hypothetical protein ABUT39_01440 [Acidobacteriota bacterium]
MDDDERVKEAAEWAKDLVRNHGYDFGLANFKSAERFGLEPSEVASELGRRSAFKRAMQQGGLTLAHKRILGTLLEGGTLATQPGGGLVALYPKGAKEHSDTFDRAFIDVLVSKRLLTSTLRLSKIGREAANELANKEKS